MPKKRRNNGRSKNNRGKTSAISCSNCKRMCPKDKAIKKFTSKELIEAASKEDIKMQSVYKDNFVFPLFYNKIYYCVSCAVHARIVRVRSAVDRRKRFVKRKYNEEERLKEKKLKSKEVKAN